MFIYGPLYTYRRVTPNTFFFFFFSRKQADLLIQSQTMLENARRWGKNKTNPIQIQKQKQNMQLSHFAQSRASNVKLATVRVVIEENSLAQRSSNFMSHNKIYIRKAHIVTHLFMQTIHIYNYWFKMKTKNIQNYVFILK